MWNRETAYKDNELCGSMERKGLKQTKKFSRENVQQIFYLILEDKHENY